MRNSLKLTDSESYDLTVVIPNYNNAQYLEKCIDSVMKQSYPVTEVIVFDDCSTDGSVKLLRQLENKYSSLHCIFSEQNVGVSMARHTAIMKAATPYITMLDADDFYISKDKLFYEMNAIKSYSATDKYGCAFSQVIPTDEAGKPLASLKVKKLAYLSRFRTITRIYRTNVPRDFCFPKAAYVAAGGYDRDCRLFEDWDLDLRLLTCSEFVFSGQLGTGYRQKGGGLSDEKAEQQLQAKKEIFQKNATAVHYTLAEKVCFYLFLMGAYYLKKLK